MEGVGPGIYIHLQARRKCRSQNLSWSTDPLPLPPKTRIPTIPAKPNCQFDACRFIVACMQLETGHLTGPLNAQLLVGSDEELPVVESAYVGSELADLIEADLFNVLLVTNQDSPEVLRVCGETDVVAILYTNGQKPKAPELRKATEMGITILSTALSLKTIPGVLKREMSEISIKDAT